ncbi:hypothetical protein ACFOY8_12500 [Thalassospira xianhensis]|uniref:Uncharacterized protein n=1 Tax=Thalassospira xianhensis MCCC 1A02616 TaxID=1177929 RepID=A0A367UDC1_9PROT|nr:hypothetical protein [Thalassospira xianhensis]RCK06317.1 hypothetical protein TH5_08935 [Thalassospira xianhensis MCCC 1A02616]
MATEDEPVLTTDYGSYFTFKSENISPSYRVVFWGPGRDAKPELSDCHCIGVVHQSLQADRERAARHKGISVSELTQEMLVRSELELAAQRHDINVDYSVRKAISEQNSGPILEYLQEQINAEIVSPWEASDLDPEYKQLVESYLETSLRVSDPFQAAYRFQRSFETIPMNIRLVHFMSELIERVAVAQASVPDDVIKACAANIENELSAGSPSLRGYLAALRDKQSGPASPTP